MSFSDRDADSGRFLRFLNLSIAVLAIIVLAAVYWFVYRPLPKTSGEIRAAISAKAAVARDALGVPHIRAANWQDAIFLQGYVTAQDRLWQMDALRRLAAGELSEIVGPAALETDKESRMLRLRRTAEEHYRRLPGADRAVLAAYARGVNAFIETHLNQLPLEFTLLGYQPRPWTAVDSILAGLQMFRNLTTTYRDEITKQTMLAGGNAEKVNALFSSRSGREEQPGSNNWVLSGAHTSSGKPMLANDPHLEYAVPATWYQIHLQSPDLNVIGVTLPGVPCIIVGHNERIAWGLTNLGFDVQDLYIEKLDPNTGTYLYRGQPEQARMERDVIAVKGGKPIEFAQWVTRHGPVWQNGNQWVALRWTALDPGTFQFPFLDLNRAANWQQFTSALARFPGPGQNFVYADTDGNIGYQATGMLPIRNGYQGDVPVDGSSGDFEWQGYIPFAELPRFYNPPGGMIVTANQNPFPPNYKYAVHGTFASEFREHQIRAMLSARKGYQPGDMLTVQKDVYSSFMHFVGRKAVEAFDRRKPPGARLSDAVTLLRNWNGQMEKGTPAPLVATLLYEQIRTRVANSASPGKGDIYRYQMAPAVVQSILANGSRGWFKSQDDAVLDCLTKALDEGTEIQGSNVKRWDYGKYNELAIKHPVGAQLPLVASFFNIGPVPMSGGATTVKQTTRRLGPSMRFVADLSAWDQSLNNLTVGESGEILSRHYKDQWEAYYTGNSFPMQFIRIEAKSTLQVNPER